MSLPIPFVSRMKELLGEDAGCFFTSLEKDSPVSIRMNRSKSSFVPSGNRIPWSDTGYILPERLTFTFDPLFHAGAYYVQEASSMFLEQILRQYVDSAVYCLDLCAAPGGKSTHLASLLPEGSLLVSNEVIKNRSYTLKENMVKWGNPSVIVTNNDPEAIGSLEHLFDVIVADVPCSGEGMFRKDPASIGEWSEANVDLCAARQRRIIHDVWDALAPGGLLVYSTCTYNTQENEENISYLAEQFGAEVLPVECPADWQVSGALTGDDPVYRFFPHRVGGEGFFCAVLRKPGDPSDRSILNVRKKRNTEKREAVPEVVTALLDRPELFKTGYSPQGYRAIPKEHVEVYTVLKEKLYLISAGVLIGEIKGKDFIPAHELALSTALNSGSYPRWDLSWEEAVRYLRKEPLMLPAGSGKGIQLVTYQEIPLGFMKNLGNRSNNLYPNEWRIRSTYLPEVPRILL